jgi:hypothetical protein
VWTITVSSSYVWVVNGIDVASGGVGNLPPLPQAAAPAAPAAPAGTVLTATTALAPVIDAAIARLASAGHLTAGQVAALRAVRFRLGDLDGSGRLGEHVPGVVTIDAGAGGRGWFVDPTPLDDAEFRPTSATQGVGVTPASAAGADLLTVVMHELTHEFGAVDLDPSAAPDALMTETLAAGVRRLPDGGSWVTTATGTQAGVVPQLWLGEEKAAAATAQAVATAEPSRGTALVAGPATTPTAPSGPLTSLAGVPVLAPDWFADEVLTLHGVAVG